MEILKEIWGFLKDRKKFWLLPIILVLLFVGVLVIFGGSSVIAPLIYTVF